MAGAGADPPGKGGGAAPVETAGAPSNGAAAGTLGVGATTHFGAFGLTSANQPTKPIPIKPIPPPQPRVIAVAIPTTKGVKNSNPMIIQLGFTS
jgi:hypothetical protein